jgi:general secretion pathway protein B
MSYVLDALRKSEQERQLAAGAPAGTLYPVMVERTAASWPWPLAMAAAGVAALALALAWWFWPRPLRQPVPPPTTAAAVAPARLAPPPLAASTFRSERAKPSSAGRPPATSADGRRADVAASPQPGPKTAATGEAGDLPAALLKELPPLQIAGFIHDEQAGSMVMVDDKLLHEGDEIAPGLRLEKILGDGALFSYKGYRFRR